MNKFLLSLFLSFVFLSANNLDIKISSNKKNFKLSQKKQKTTTLKIKDLAFQIKKQDFQLKKLEVKISLINKDIKTHETLLNKSQGSLKKLLKSSSHLKYQKKEQEEQIVNVIINNFTSSIALELASKDSLDALINQEIYNLLNQHSKDKILIIDSRCYPTQIACRGTGLQIQILHQDLTGSDAHNSPIAIVARSSIPLKSNEEKKSPVLCIPVL